jgi:hypothetical protein
MEGRSELKHSSPPPQIESSILDYRGGATCRPLFHVSLTSISLHSFKIFSEGQGRKDEMNSLFSSNSLLIVLNFVLNWPSSSSTTAASSAVESGGSVGGSMDFFFCVSIV